MHTTSNWVNAALRAHKDARVPIDVSSRPMATCSLLYHHYFAGTCLYAGHEAPAVYPGENWPICAGTASVLSYFDRR